MSVNAPSLFNPSLEAQRQREIQAMRDAREAALKAEADRKAHDVAKKLHQPAKLTPTQNQVLQHLARGNEDRHDFSDTYFFKGQDIPSGVMKVKPTVLKPLFSAGYVTEKRHHRQGWILLEITPAGREWVAKQAEAELKPFDSAALIAIAAVKAKQAWATLALLVRIRIVALDRLLRAATAKTLPALVQPAPRPMLMLAAPAQPVALLPATVTPIAVFGWNAGASAQVSWDKQIGWDAIKATARKYAQEQIHA